MLTATTGRTRRRTAGRRPISLAAARLAAAGAALTLVLAAAAGGATGAGAALRGGGGACPPAQTDCHVWDSKPGDPGNPGNPGGGGKPGNGGGGSHTCTRAGETVPCYDDLYGWFNQADGCYYKLAEPQPSGGDPGTKAYTRFCGTGGAAGFDTVWLAAPPPGVGAPPDPAEIARELEAQLTLAFPKVGIAPAPGRPGGLVGLPVWLWTGEPAGQDRDTAWGPQGRDRHVAGMHVEITAKVQYADWNLGNGAGITCRSQGERHTDQTGRAPCGYDGYPASGTYGVSVTTHWHVEWRVDGGPWHALDDVPRTSETAQVIINELQVVTQ
ncbi:hypothetical protein ACFFWC_04915 [Plantactinospora siamensis]|uniref:ATP/GTP-binding protein n=1 Tax=Plantactinospora siamensis TaxID=555372 RepID=A0ABV6NRN8_9ACTN